MPRVFFVSTIDTEADHNGGSVWRRSDPLTFHSITDGVVRKLEPLFKHFGAKPTLLLTYEVLQSPTAVDALRELRNCELGAHLHGECVPPENVDCAGILPRDLQGFYPRELERAKLATLCESFESALGYRPLSFRAGSFGAGGQTVASLAELGFRAESSVTPHVRWQHPQGIIDFSNAPEQPYFPSQQDICARGKEGILEVPATISVLPSRILRQIRPTWLRPSFSTAQQMVRVIDDYMDRYRNEHSIVLNMMFHSMEAIPDASPYVKTERQAVEFLERIEHVLAYAASRGAEFCTLSELADRWSGESVESAVAGDRGGSKDS